MQRKSKQCSDCHTNLDRRDFLRTTGVVITSATTTSMLAGVPAVHAAPASSVSAETSAKQFYESLSEKQLLTICFPFNHALRQRINANWHITKPLIGDDFYSDGQRAMIGEILKNVTSEDGYERLIQQMDEDDGGVDAYSVAVFGEPGSSDFQWVLTGRHLTLRADGDRGDKTAFGGPLVYGHGEEDPGDNLFHHQTKKANEVFRALDAKQARQALLKSAPKESAVAIQGDQGTFPGLALGDLSDDQKQLVEETLEVLLSPYREADVKEVMSILKGAGGVDKLSMAFYQQGDLESDQVWDIWRVEGPSFVWHFRGAPHVHAYINIGTTKPSADAKQGARSFRSRRGRPAGSPDGERPERPARPSRPPQ